MRFRAQVEPPEPMRGLEIPPGVVEALGGGKRPPVTITVNGHTWRSRVAVLRGRSLLGFSLAHREAAGVATGDEVEVDLEIDDEPRTVDVPEDLARALDADPVVHAAFDRLPDGRRRQHVRSVESAKKPDTRARRVRQVVASLRDGTPSGTG